MPKYDVDYCENPVRADGAREALGIAIRRETRKQFSAREINYDGHVHVFHVLKGAGNTRWEDAETYSVRIVD